VHSAGVPGRIISLPTAFGFDGRLHGSTRNVRSSSVRLTSNSRRDAGELDNTLIIFISSDNGTSAEGSAVGTPFDQAALEAVDIPVADQLKYYDVWGSDKTQPHMAVAWAWAWAFDTPFKRTSRSRRTSAAPGRV
jgi:hypothetical protein